MLSAIEINIETIEHWVVFSIHVPNNECQGEEKLILYNGSSTHNKVKRTVRVRNHSIKKHHEN